MVTNKHVSKGSKNTYWGSIAEGVSSLWSGIILTFKHLLQALKFKREPIGVENKDYFSLDKGIVTLQYPHEAIPVPDNGRYRLHNEIDDCIVCDLCAKICPVNCIEIDAIKSTEEIGKTSDGSTKRIYAGTFDIDMGKCCYCGLCTTVCPTECLTMTKTYDYSEFDIRNMVYHFTDMTPEQAEEKRKIYEEKQKEKAKPKAEQPKAEGSEKAQADKPAFKPVIKPSVPAESKPEEKKGESGSENAEGKNEKPSKPVFKPVIKGPAKPKTEGEESEQSQVGENVKSESGEIKSEEKKSLPKPVFKPVIKAPSKPKTEGEEGEQSQTGDNVKPESGEVKSEEKKSPPKPVFKPVIKPKPKQEGNQGDQ